MKEIKSKHDGRAEAQALLGSAYRDGQGVPKDEAEAVKWYRKAAEDGKEVQQFDKQGNFKGAKRQLGNITAQNNLGNMYANGRGVPKDDAEAVKWYRKAADQGNALAQRNLGFMYDNGQGVPKDEAVKWFRKAAEQGNASAHFNLGVMYAKGEGVPKDDVTAYKWILLAGATDEKARENIPVIEKRLTPEQRAEGQKLAREFKAVKESP